MKRSESRILTTHAGSLARPEDLLDIMRLKESDQPYDHAAFDSRVRTAVAEVVGHQVNAGIPAFYHYSPDRVGAVGHRFVDDGL